MRYESSGTDVFRSPDNPLTMKRLQFSATAADSGQRLDSVLAGKEDVLSRSQVKQAVQDGRVRVNGALKKPSCKISSGDIIEIEIPDPVFPAAQPENIPVEVLYEDAWLIVINKPAQMVVHPACGHYTGTLVNALLHHCENLSGIGGVLRPGIVHRLDKGTTGVLVVAKNDAAHHHLSAQFQRHTVIRKYSALVFGVPGSETGTVSSPIGRHYAERKKMSTRARRGKDAVTHWRILESFDSVTLLEAQLETGRTHQVRVHLASIQHPIAGDETYGAIKRLKAVKSKTVHDLLKGLTRPMLHAGYLSFTHPETNRPVAFASSIPDDFAHVLAVLREACHA